MSDQTFTGWDALSRWDDQSRLEDDENGQSGHLDETTVSRLLLIELERPPWYRELDAARRELEREAA